MLKKMFMDLYIFHIWEMPIGIVCFPKSLQCQSSTQSTPSYRGELRGEKILESKSSLEGDHTGCHQIKRRWLYWEKVKFWLSFHLGFTDRKNCSTNPHNTQLTGNRAVQSFRLVTTGWIWNLSISLHLSLQREKGFQVASKYDSIQESSTSLFNSHRGLAELV